MTVLDKIIAGFQLAFDNEDSEAFEGSKYYFVRHIGGIKEFQGPGSVLEQLTLAFYSEDVGKFKEAMSRLRSVFSDGGSWVSNEGNSTGICPVDSFSLTEIKLRDGTAHIGAAHGWNWQVLPNFRSNYDILTYRVIHEIK